MDANNLTFTDNIQTAFFEYCFQQNIQNPIVICDDNTQQFCLPLLEFEGIQSIVIPNGEQNKNSDVLMIVLNKMLELDLTKHSTIFNLGGGMVSDLGGFAASIFKRGIQFVNIPTSLLAMVDAAIGGKNGIDFKHYKNVLGTFNEANQTIISTEFLKTLPTIEIQSALAEIIKVSIMFDQSVFEEIQSDFDIQKIVKKCALIKQSVVEIDFHDKNERQKLNFGHTIGHALESYYLSIDKQIPHGFAVAKGMLFEISIAQKLKLLNDTDANKMNETIIKKIGIEPISENEFNQLKPFLKGDKKNTQDKILFSLPNTIGNGSFGHQLSMEDINF